MPRNEFKAGDRGDDPEVEDLSQEVHPVEDESPELTVDIHRRLADLRGVPGGAITKAHIAERYSADETPLLD